MLAADLICKWGRRFVHIHEFALGREDVSTRTKSGTAMQNEMSQN